MAAAPPGGPVVYTYDPSDDSIAGPFPVDCNPVWAACSDDCVLLLTSCGRVYIGEPKQVDPRSYVDGSWMTEERELEFSPLALPWSAASVHCASGFAVALSADCTQICTFSTGQSPEWLGEWEGSPVDCSGRSGFVRGLPGGGRIACLAVGCDNVFAATESGEVYAWGDNGSGTLGIGSEGSHHGTPQLVAGLSGCGLRRLAAGSLQGVAETRSGVVGWGDYSFFNCDPPGYPTPRSIDDGRSVQLPLRSLQAGLCHAVAADAVGKVWAWGTVDGMDFLSADLIPMPGGESVVRLASGQSYILALTESGALYSCADVRSWVDIRAKHPQLPPGLLPVGGPAADRFLLLKQENTVLRCQGRDFTAADLGMPLSDAGIAAETAVELLLAPPVGTQPAEDGPLQVFVSAPGRSQPVCLELAADTTIGGLAARAADQLGLTLMLQ
eukprot:TRINITY_DN13874_c0_g1_i1.p1 TRINITY_DN13874_c0_g1~~TRINITY_DN13874_c0_g1_i1.p1  ORF type:complete len:441 (+),score=49.03 TRINITY_DN13874_c0_g1_i1:82-1404(+)